MVKEFKGWQAEDGTVFDTREAAVQHEARKQFAAQLMEDGCNEGQIAKLSANFQVYAEIFLAMEKNKRVASK